LSLFIEILTTITLPVILLMVLGWIAQSRLALDVASLSRFLLNVVLPCALLHFLTSAELPLADAWPTAWFTIVLFGVLMALGWAVARLLGFPAEIRPVIGLAVAFPNTGNFGIPVAQLAFPPDFLLHQTIIVSLHGILIVLAGILVLSDRRGGALESLKTLATSPMIVAVVVGLALKGANAELPHVLGHPVKLVAAAFTPLALLTLGAQLANTCLSSSRGPVWVAVFLKSLLAPALTWIAAWSVGIDDDVTDLLVVAAAAPVGLLVALFCTEYKRSPDMITTAVLVSTVLSPLVVTAWILAVRLY
jgi:predicted permease